MRYSLDNIEEIVAILEGRGPKVKKKEIKKIREEVFDAETLRTVWSLMDKKIIKELEFVIATGKEANVFRGIDWSGHHIAVKIYRIETTSFRNMWRYLWGDPRFGRIRKDRRSIIFAWTKKEFKNLVAARDAGVLAPLPIAYMKNVLVMEFLGENGIPYPKLKEVFPENPKEFAEELIENVGRFVRAGYVHADISEFNILVGKDKPYLIDFGQAVPFDHPFAEEFYLSDLRNLTRVLSSLGLEISLKELDERLRKENG